MAYVFGQSLFHLYDVSGHHKEFLLCKNVAEITPGLSDIVQHLLISARHLFNSPSQSPIICGQADPNLNDYHRDRMEISRTFWILDMTDTCRQQEDVQSK